MKNNFRRVSNNIVEIDNEYGIDARLFANENISVEKKAIAEFWEFLNVQNTINELVPKKSDFFDNAFPAIKRIALTPDFHKGSGIPIGTVLATKGIIIPQAIGNDVNCGMCLYITEYTDEEIIKNKEAITKTLRQTFFEGSRNIPMTGIQKEAMFKEGIRGLLNSSKREKEGLWSLFHRIVNEEQLKRTAFEGGLFSQSILGLEDFIGEAERKSRNDQIGSIGGGNHFVEIQRVEKVLDKAIAYAWGLKKNQVVIMIHSGSLMLGHLAGAIYRDMLQNIFPNGFAHPKNKIFPLPDNERFSKEVHLFKETLYNAANFAFANRAFLGLMAIDCLWKTCGESKCELLYDAPHNFIWEEELEGEPVYIHRKGACSARSMEQMRGTVFEYYGEPVLVPGSMGTSSFILSGLGNAQSLWSASHGAGRALSRGQALKADKKSFENFFQNANIVTPIDFSDQTMKMRQDIVREKLADIQKEAPFAYKNIDSVITTLQDAEMASPVAELNPLITIKAL